MDLYSEIILDHYHNPHNKGTIKNADASVKEHNPLCGDIIQIDLKIKKGKVEEIKFSGEGCAISQAAVSMLTDELIGKTPAQIKKMTDKDILKLLHVKINPGRIKCALLGLVTAQKAAIIAEHKVKPDPS